MIIKIQIPSSSPQNPGSFHCPPPRHPLLPRSFCVFAPATLYSSLSLWHLSLSCRRTFALPVSSAWNTFLPDASPAPSLTSSDVLCHGSHLWLLHLYVSNHPTTVPLISLCCQDVNHCNEIMYCLLSVSPAECQLFEGRAFSALLLCVPSTQASA